MTIKSKNIVWSLGNLTKADREAKNNHKGFTLWLTGLSGSGKSTIAHGIQEELYKRGAQVYVLDGDNLRHGLNSDLGFAPQDRTENIRRSGQVSKLFNDAGIITVTAFISPYQEDRQKVRESLNEGEFIEVFINPSLEVCEKRDTKGLYKKARAGEISEFTGISAPYEEPEHAEITVDTEALSVEESVAKIIDYLTANGHIKL